MNNIFLYITTILILSSATVAAQSIQWPATVTDATSRSCNDGAIDLHPPPSPLTYSYTWFNQSSNVPIGYAEDVTDLNEIIKGDNFSVVSTEMIDCYRLHVQQKSLLVELASGKQTEITRRVSQMLISKLTNTKIIRTGDLDLKVASGTYMLVKESCEPLKFVIL